MSRLKGRLSPFCGDTFLRIILIGVLSCACNSSATQDVRQRQNEIQAAEAVKIEEVWEEKVKRLHEKLKNSNVNKGSAGEEFDILAELLRSASTGVADAELDRMLRGHKAYEQMSPYEQTFIQFHIDKYENENNREKLVYIIRNKSPRNVGYVSLELGITNAKKPENLIVLFDAYDTALDAQTRSQLLAILRSVFADLHEPYTNDDQFLAASKQWLLANQTKLKINPGYSPFAPDLQRRKFFIPLGVGAYSSHDSSGKSDTCGEEVSGLRSCIWLDSQELGTREKVLVHYKIQNVSAGEIVIWQSGFWPNNTIVVLNDHGESIKLTKEGRRNLAAFAPGGDRNKNFPVRLKSKESIYVDTQDLRRFFVFYSPGNYTIRFIYEEYQDSGWQGKLTSNELRFRIK